MIVNLYVLIWVITTHEGLTSGTAGPFTLEDCSVQKREMEARNYGVTPTMGGKFQSKIVADCREVQK